MARVKRGVTAHARHKKILDLAKGYRGRGSKAYRVAIEKVEKGLQYAYRDRRNKKREFRALWIQRINAGARLNGLTYSQFMDGLKKSGIEVDRKVLSDIAAQEPDSFRLLVDQAKTALGGAAAQAA
jgi:large subunit ribosomal protein L20